MTFVLVQIRFMAHIFHLHKEQPQCGFPPTNIAQGKRKVVEISNFTASAELMIDTVEVHCHSQCNSTTCCQENYKVISYNPLQDQLPKYMPRSDQHQAEGPTTI